MFPALAYALHTNQHGLKNRQKPGKTIWADFFGLPKAD
jgi:hypothetical protein